MMDKIPAYDMPGLQTSAESARVQGGYESLDVKSTKMTYEELNGVLEKLATTVVQTLDQMVPYLAKMQSLLSQRGADRRKVLQQAGLPGWTHWAKAYASKLDRSLRTIQDRIKQFRGQQAGGTTGKTKSGSTGERLKLDSRQQAALVKAQVAANDLVAALKSGADWQTPLAEYQKVAVAPARLDTFMNALSPEPDWKSILKQLVDMLEECGGELPVPVRNALRAAQKLLDGKADQQQVTSGKGKAGVKEQSCGQKPRNDSTCCVVPREEMPSGGAQKLSVLVRGTACPTVPDPKVECGHGTLGAVSVQGSTPVAAVMDGTPPEQTSAEYQSRKAGQQKESWPGKKHAELAAQAAKPATPQPAATPAPEQGTKKKARKAPESVKTKVCPPALSPEEEERKQETSVAASNYPGRRQGDFVLNENRKYEYDPELEMAEADEIQETQPGSEPVPPREPMASIEKSYRVKPRSKPGFKTDYLIICGGDKQPYDVFDTECEAKTVCESLNSGLVGNIVSQHTNALSAAQAA
ncbi:MAG: hypothetical protein P4N24_15670 [Acidobacteriota bacterium]|nr:hypothetical protein [Acidobacteriota bacterium]